ncbi:hypothetical protein C4K37_3669 [Pseudomonas chlororaphis subsp. piscium]|nr:hypothetical protein C4K37_3669 [Pseudomonas chlororaphis subsp. piscium]AZC44600.1 hypothetical protein C4K36_3677 [Pseudomonas chlororaphis subsp. piscium]
MQAIEGASTRRPGFYCSEVPQGHKYLTRLPLPTLDDQAPASA